jgi:MraZ protein|tara:strand:- start:1748 stop:2194 length:447 start_codon:yes stop_codon:yes gene_type:complete
LENSGVSFFVGEFVHSVDEKGRITIPSKWRIEGGENTYLALPNPGGYVTVYPPKMVARLEEKVAEARMSDATAQALLMELFSKAHSFGCDKQGRINLNDKLLGHADIHKKAVLVGNFSAFAVWGQHRYSARGQASERTIFDAMRDLGL